MRISDWSSDVCSSDLWVRSIGAAQRRHRPRFRAKLSTGTSSNGARVRRQPSQRDRPARALSPAGQRTRTVARKLPTIAPSQARSEEHTSELQSLMRISYAVFRLKKTKQLYNYIIP